MKRFLLLYGLFLNVSVHAQIREQYDVEVIALIGFLNANYYGSSEVRDNKSITTFTYGFNADFYQNERWSVRLGYESKILGSNGYSNNLYSKKELKAKEKLKYVYIPVHANWHFGNERNWNLNFGPSISFLKSLNFNNKDISIDGLSNMQFGLGLGIGYKYKISDQFSLSIEHQEYLAISNNINNIFKNSPFIGNYFGSLELRLIYNFKTKKLFL